MGRECRRAAVLLLGGIVLAVPGPIAAQDADHDNCYCPVGIAPGHDDNLSHVTNAWICTSTEKPGPPCAITVMCLSDEVSGPDCPEEPHDKAGDFDAFIKMLPEMARKHYAEIGIEPPFKNERLLAYLWKSRATIEQCLDRFGDGGNGEMFSAVSKGLVPGSEGLLRCVILPSGGLQIIVGNGLINLGDIEQLAFHFNLPR